MIECYKLTDEHYMTHGNTKWGECIAHEKPTVERPSLCSDTVLHYYRSIPLAFILNPNHANIKNPVLWLSECDREVVGDYGKAGCYVLRTKKRLRYNFTDEQLINIRVRFAILCAESVIKIWSDKYPNDDRPQKAIEAAREYLRTKSKDAARAAAARSAAYAAADAARSAAYAAADAAYAAADAARAAAARSAAYAAADAAARAADAAAYAGKIDFDALATKAWIAEFLKGRE